MNSYFPTRTICFANPSPVEFKFSGWVSFDKYSTVDFTKIFSR